MTVCVRAGTAADRPPWISCRRASPCAHALRRGPRPSACARRRVRPRAPHQGQWLRPCLRRRATNPQPIDVTARSPIRRRRPPSSGLARRSRAASRRWIPSCVGRSARWEAAPCTFAAPGTSSRRRKRAPPGERARGSRGGSEPLRNQTPSRGSARAERASRDARRERARRSARSPRPGGACAPSADPRSVRARQEPAARPRSPRGRG